MCNPITLPLIWRNEHRFRENRNRYTANSVSKQGKVGFCSSWQAAKHFNEAATITRDELMEEIAQENIDTRKELTTQIAQEK